ncbi:MAG: hypothetical protein R3302_09260 [Sulfurimonadaceae bacterium]|nr:hypothetical protein [Sulfurimonadaceae bacterium]
MQAIEKILHENETVQVVAKISKTYYNDFLVLYALALALMLIGYEMEIGILGLVLFLRTLYLHLHAIQDKRFYYCVLTDERLIIHKGYKKQEIFPVKLEEIRTIYIKPYSERFKGFIDVGTLEVITTSGGRFVIDHIKSPYTYHRAIIGDIVDATNYAKRKKRSKTA